jgi:hypothetical protein
MHIGRYDDVRVEEDVGQVFSHAWRHIDMTLHVYECCRQHGRRDWSSFTDSVSFQVIKM